MHIIMYGPEGSGKGTQAQLLGETLHVPIFTSGDVVRETATSDSGHLGDVCREALKEGKYVADAEMYTLMEKKIVEAGATNSWIMDGFPRNINQAQYLDEKLKVLSTSIDAVLYLYISEEESLKRLLKRARPLHPGSAELHDTPQRIKNRLEVYNSMQKDMLDYYRRQDKVIQIDAEKPVDDIQKEIIDALHYGK